ncbi:MAG TPA: ABATE domain-containing protein [Kribbella sp.]|nr:ABATE domain-containing protein [Kribbella sp.]
MSALDLRFDTGTLSTDFVATVGRRLAGGCERLTSAGRLAEWLVHADLAAPDIPVSDVELQQARASREAIYRLMLSRIAERPGTPADVRVVNGWARKRTPAPQLSVDGAFALQPVDADVGTALGVIARDAIEVVAGTRAESLRACEATDCGMLYLDLSQGRTRRWCSMKECGNRAKVAAYRSRRKRDPT